MSVVTGLETNLLGLPAITVLNLATRVDSATSTSTDIQEKFPRVFKGLGNLRKLYEIKLKPDAKPYALFTPRHVPLPLCAKVNEELARMEAMGKGGQAYTMVCGNGCGSQEIMCRSHLCEPEAPQQRVQREVNPLPKIDETLAQITGAVGFGKSPSQSSRLLTTITTSSVGLSARWMMCWSLGKIRPNMTNDSQPYSSKSSLHAGVTLNPDKCEFGKTKLKFLGDLINESGIHGDPDKTSAIVEMRPPGNVSELRRFMGMVNQLGKFTPNLTELTQPLRELLTKKSTWLWGPSQNQAFLQVKAELVQATTLALYDVGAATKISADASPYGLGAVLLQEVNSSWKPVAYASRSMTETER